MKEKFLNNLAKCFSADHDINNSMADWILPNKKDEKWNFINIDKILNLQLSINKNSKNNEEFVQIINNIEFVKEKKKLIFVDGNISINSNVDYNIFKSKQSSNENSFFNKLNEEFNKEKILLTINDAKIDELYIIKIITNDNILVQSNIELNIESDIQIKTLTIDNNKYKNNFINDKLKINISENIHCDVNLYHSKEQNISFNQLEINQMTNSSLRLFYLNHKNNLLRNELTLNSLGENTNTDIYSLSETIKDNILDNIFQINHYKSNCFSNQIIKIVSDDKSKTNFFGKIFIDKKISKIEANQSAKQMILCDSAKINVKPQLEIYSDDVKCSHGATIGNINEDQIYYMQSRGIEREKAKKILINAFVNDNIEKFISEDEINYLF